MTGNVLENEVTLVISDTGLWAVSTAVAATNDPSSVDLLSGTFWLRMRGLLPPRMRDEPMPTTYMTLTEMPTLRVRP